MLHQMRGLGWAIAQSSAVVIGLVIGFAEVGVAQIVPDETLGAEGSRVRNFGAADAIDQGARRGANLFHSFREFNVGEGRSAYFLNPSNDIRNILARVTGNTRSEILGTLGTLNLNGVTSTPNLFLINPNGIVFGQNARLDVGGSFVGTTANAIGFGDRGWFSATSPETPSPLLTISPSVFLFNQIQAGGIVNSSIAPNTNVFGLRVPSQRSLLLVGGDVTLDGGRLNSDSGHIELGGLAAPGTVGLQTQGEALNLVFPTSATLANVNLTNDAQVLLSGGASGGVTVNANVLNASGGGRLATLTSGAERGGNITVNANTINLVGVGQSGFSSGFISVAPASTTGNGGNIVVNAQLLNIRDRANIQAVALGRGNAGNIQINADDNVSISGDGTTNILTGISSASGDTAGRSGNINITAGSLSLENRSGQITSSTLGQGGSGDITVNVRDRVSLSNRASINSILLQGASGRVGNISISTGSLQLTNGASVSSAIAGQGVNDRGSGDISINARDAISITNSSISSGLVPGAVGRGGSIRIDTGNLFLAEGGFISAATSGNGDAGDITINARGAMSLNIRSGISSSAFLVSTSNLIGSPNISARSGNIVISAGLLSLREQSSITSSLAGTGQAGDITINTAGSVLLDGGSDIGSDSLGFDERLREYGFDERLRSIGDAGDINISAESMTFRNGSQVTSGIGNNSQGVGGNVNITVRGALFLDGTLSTGNLQSAILTRLDPGAVGQGGDININAGSVVLTNGAQLTANTRGQGNAGNVFINSRNQVSLTEGSGINSNTQGQGNAGNIVVSARGDVSLSRSSVNSSVFSGAVGKGGDITINAGTLTLGRRGTVSSTSSGQGDAGNITATSRGLLSVLAGGRFTSSTLGQGNAGNITLSADRMTFIGVAPGERQFGGVFSAVGQGGRGNGGRIRIDTGSLSLSDRAALGSTTGGKGNAGDIEITSRGAISLNDGLISSAVYAGAVGNGGDIRIQARSLTANRGSRIEARLSREQRDAQGNLTSGGQGRAGDISVDASDFVLLSGSDRAGASSGIISSTGAGSVGNAGNISVQTHHFSVENGAVVAAGTTNSQKGGNISVNAQTFEALDGGEIITNTRSRGNAGTIQLDIAGDTTIAGADPNFDRRVERARAYLKTPEGRADQSILSDLILNPDIVSGVFANTAPNSSGQSGTVRITTDRLNVQNSAAIAVNSQGTGQAGNLTVSANAIQLDRGTLNAETRSTSKQEGANITLQEIDRLLYLQNGSQISARAFDNANGGNVTVNAGNGFVIARTGASQNNDIVAKASGGNGGQVSITAQGILGLEQRPSTPANTTNDIDVSSDQGLQGTVTLNLPNTDPSRGLTELPTIPINATNQIASACPTTVQEADRLGSFIVSGRGGLPPSPIDLLSEDNVLTEWVTPSAESKNATEVPASTPQAAIVEAQGWVKDNNGEIRLVAPPITAATASSLDRANCRSHSRP